MSYFDTVRSLLEGQSVMANALEHELCEIVREVRSRGSCTRDFVGMNNAYFRLFGVFESGWQKEINRFCEEFNFVFSVTDNGTTIQFRRSS